MKKRVLLVSAEGLGNGGVPVVIMNTVRNLKEEYTFDIVLFTSERRLYDDEFESYGGRIFRIPFYDGKSAIRRRVDYYIRGRYIYKALLKLLRSGSPYDVIDCNNHYESALCLKAAQKCGIPVRITRGHIDSAKRNAFLI